VSLTALAVLLISIWLILASQEPVSDTLTLVFGIVAAVLVLFDAFGGTPFVFKRFRD